MPTTSTTSPGPFATRDFSLTCYDPGVGLTSCIDVMQGSSLAFVAHAVYYTRTYNTLITVTGTSIVINDPYDWKTSATTNFTWEQWVHRNLLNSGMFSAQSAAPAANEDIWGPGTEIIHDDYGQATVISDNGSSTYIRLVSGASIYVLRKDLRLRGVNHSPQQCTCPLDLLMRSGCACGGFAAEQAAKGKQA